MKASGLGYTILRDNSYASNNDGLYKHAVETGVFGLAINYSAAEAENYRAGLQAIPKGQMEAATSTGLKHWQAMVYIILPQGLRNMIPSFVNQFVSLIKDTSLAFIVGGFAAGGSDAYVQLTITQCPPSRKE